MLSIKHDDVGFLLLVWERVPTADPSTQKVRRETAVIRRAPVGFPTAFGAVGGA